MLTPGAGFSTEAIRCIHAGCRKKTNAASPRRAWRVTRYPHNGCATADNSSITEIVTCDGYQTVGAAIQLCSQADREYSQPKRANSRISSGRFWL